MITSPQENPPPEKLDTYSTWALEKFGRLSLLGVDGGDISLDLNKVYVPLRISQRAFGVDLKERRGRIAEEAWQQSAGDVKLEEAFKNTDGGLRQCVVLFGEPGAGKTTSLKKMLHHCLIQGSHSLGLPEGLMPVFLRLRHFSEEYLHIPLQSFIDKELEDLSAGRFPKELGRDYWKDGKLLLLFDGLDEIADYNLRAKVAKRINDGLVGLQNQQIYAAVSCRFTGYGDGVRLENFFPLDVKPLDGEQVEEFVKVWFDEAGQYLVPDLAKEAKARSLRLLKAMDEKDFADQRIKILMGNPLLLTLLCVVVLRGGEIPKKRAAFYQRCLDILLGKWRREQTGGEPLLDVKTTLDILRPLAWKLHQENRRDNVKRLEFANFAEKRLASQKNRPTGLQILEWLHRDTGVFIEYAPSQYGFMHLGLQEYLAARHVVMASSDETLLDFLASQGDEKWWREVLLLLVGIPDHQLFAPFMTRLLPDILKGDRANLMRDMLTEAEQTDYSVFAKALQDKKTSVGHLTAILRLLKGVTDTAVLTAAEGLKQHTDENVSRLAQGLLGEAGGKDYDLLLIHDADGETFAEQLAPLLADAGVHVWPKTAREWVSNEWLQYLDPIRAKVGAVAFLLGAEDRLFTDAECEEGLHYLASNCHLITVFTPDSPVTPKLPAPLGTVMIDARFSLAAGAKALVNAVHGREITATKILEPLPGLRLLPVPGGIFTMGDNNGDDVEKPEHRVKLSPFLLAETPVTNQQYGIFLKATKRKEPGYWRNQRFSDPEQPVVGVDWDDAMAFCAWLSKESGRPILLPSEAQWEYAARGSDGRVYPWGDNDPTKELACFGLDRHKGKPELVGQYPAGRGPFGHLDLAGNVWEWCRDIWDEKAYEKRTGAVPIQNPVVSEGNRGWHPIRGGSWDVAADHLRAARRGRYLAGLRFDVLGFRVAAPASMVDP
ncbi:MAG: SUMF1/EgtB/PvdO family nonheme iron enzyme [Magnetococcus sp. THC-1_WYH]